MRIARLTGTLAALLAAVLCGCMTRSVTEIAYDNRPIEVKLRKQVKGFEEVDRGFEHPAVISVERLTNILASVNIEMSQKKKGTFQRNAIAAELIRPMAEGMARAFAEASPNQELAVLAVLKVKQHLIFHRNRLTSLSAYVKDGALFIYVSRVEWEIPQHREDNLPLPVVGEEVMDFRTVGGTRVYPVGDQGLSIAWRDPVFKRAPALLLGDSNVRQRTILAEEAIPQSELGTTLPAEAVRNLSPETLRSLADLEEARRAGSITENEYHRERDELLSRE